MSHREDPSPYFYRIRSWPPSTNTQQHWVKIHLAGKAVGQGNDVCKPPCVLVCDSGKSAAFEFNTCVGRKRSSCVESCLDYWFLSSLIPAISAFLLEDFLWNTWRQARAWIYFPGFQVCLLQLLVCIFWAASNQWVSSWFPALNLLNVEFMCTL